MSRSKKIAIFMKGGQYDSFRDKLFLFDVYFDCLSYKEVMYILNKDSFQKIFRFYELLLKVAQKTLRTIQKYVPIDNFDAFSESCKGHYQKLAKLKNISTKPYLKQLNIKIFKKVIKDCDLPIETTGRGANEKLVYNTSDKWAILKLLDDDYLKSIMTGQNYEVNSKRELDK